MTSKESKSNGVTEATNTEFGQGDFATHMELPSGETNNQETQSESFGVRVCHNEQNDQGRGTCSPKI